MERYFEKEGLEGRMEKQGEKEKKLHEEVPEVHLTSLLEETLKI